MSERKGIFARAAERLKKPATTREQPDIIESGPLEHETDGQLHANGISRNDDGHVGKQRVARDLERDNRAGPSEELDRGYGDRGSQEI
jgi:hypothetical protein